MTGADQNVSAPSGAARGAVLTGTLQAPCQLRIGHSAIPAVAATVRVLEAMLGGHLPTDELVGSTP